MNPLTPNSPVPRTNPTTSSRNGSPPVVQQKPVSEAPIAVPVSALETAQVGLASDPKAAKQVVSAQQQTAANMTGPTVVAPDLRSQRAFSKEMRPQSATVENPGSARDFLKDKPKPNPESGDPTSAVQGESRLKDPPQQAPVSYTKGGQLASRCLAKPGQLGRIDAAHSNLRLARDGQHPDQLKFQSQMPSQETKKGFTENQRRLETERQQLLAQGKADQATVNSGFQEQRDHLRQATERRAKAEDAMDPKLRARVDEYLTLEQKARAEKDPDAASLQRQALQNLNDRLARDTGLNMTAVTARMAGASASSHEHALVEPTVEWLRSRIAQKHAGDFPQTPAASQQWLQQRQAERQGRTSDIERQLDEIKNEVDRHHSVVKADLEKGRVDNHQSVVDKLETELANSKRFKASELSPALLGCETIKRVGQGAQIRVGEKDLHILDVIDREECGTITEQANGALKVEATSRRDQFTWKDSSLLTPDAQGGFTEESCRSTFIKESGQERHFSDERVYKDSAGAVKETRTTTYDAEQDQTVTNRFSQQGKLERRVDETNPKNGGAKRTQTTDFSYASDLETRRIKWTEGEKVTKDGTERVYREGSALRTRGDFKLPAENGTLSENSLVEISSSGVPGRVLEFDRKRSTVRADGARVEKVEYERRKAGAEETRTIETVNDRVTSDDYRLEQDGRLVESRTVRNDSTMSHTQTHKKHPDGTATEREVQIYKSGRHFEVNRQIDAKGNRTADSVDSYKNAEGYQVEDVEKHVGFHRVSLVRTEEVKPNPDVDGLGAVGSYNPQQLLGRLGPESELRAQRVTTTTAMKDGPDRVEIVNKLVNKDGTREVLQSQAANGARVWEYREKNGNDGTWNSQTFFQGTDDTITTTHSKADGFHIETTEGRTPKLAEKNPELPTYHLSTTHSSDAASLAQIDNLLSGRIMNQVKESDSYNDFLKQAGPGPFKVVMGDSLTNVKGRDLKGGQLILESPDGRRLTAIYDPAKRTCAISNEAPNPDEPIQMSFLHHGRGGSERLEVGPNQIESFAQSGRGWVKNTTDLMALPEKWTEGVGEAGKLIRQHTRFDQALIGWKGVEDVPLGKWGQRIGTGSNSLCAGLSALTLGAQIANRDPNAVRTAGTLGMDLAGAAQAFDDAGWKALKGKGGAAGAASQASWVSRGGRMLGGAGVVTGAFFAAHDFAEGNTGRGLIAAASTGGSALAMFGTASWAGPAGWGVAGVATLASLAWDYNEGTTIADYALPH